MVPEIREALACQATLVRKMGKQASPETSARQANAATRGRTVNVVLTPGTVNRAKPVTKV